MSLTDAQIKQIADTLFLFQKPAQTKLAKPNNTTGADSLAAKLDSQIGDDPRFTDMGIGVIDFPSDKSAPKVWLHNGDDSWRVGSTAKIAVLLAAVQLRDDVRKINGLKIISTPAEFDDLFSTSRLWAKSQNSMIQQIAGKDHAPRISAIFDFNKAEIDFVGLDLSSAGVSGTDRDATFKSIYDRLTPPADPRFARHLTWPTAPDFTFSERLWLTGALSDDVAATSCVSEIGIYYIRAVQQAYGLFDPKHGMHLLLSGGYSGEPTDKKKFRNVEFRGLDYVNDITATGTRKNAKELSWVPGSAAALSAFMIAMINNQFVMFGNEKDKGEVACTTIKNCLSSGGPQMTRSFIAEGTTEGGAGVNITKQITKIGLLGKEDGEAAALNSEFAYLETNEPDGTRSRQYGVVAIGIRSQANADGTPGLSTGNLAKDIGIKVHKALIA